MSIRPWRRLAGTLLVALVALVPSAALSADGANPSPVLVAARAEMGRSLEQLGKQSEPPYFLSYEITESHSVLVRGSFGTLVDSSGQVNRLLDIDLRVGDYALDNTRPIRGGNFMMDFLNRFSMVEMPIDDDPDAIRSVLWYHTDRKYKQAVERLTQVRTNVQVKVEQEDKSADFSKEKPEKYVGRLQSLKLDRPAWEERVRRYTAPFASHGNIYEAEAILTANLEQRWFVNSEGSEIQTSQIRYRLFISAFTKADDGMELPRYESFMAFTPEGLPDDQTVLDMVERMILDLQALREAPVIDPYIGPAILSGRASGVFFHEVFGHRIEGHRQKSEDEGQTFKKMVGEKLLPEAFSVYFDPTRPSIAGVDLAGFYRYDNQGVKARRVPVLEQGVFKSFLMSRTPVEGFPKSNGHGRKQASFSPVARQSNLIVEVKNPVSHDQLRQMLLQRIQDEGKPFGLVFEDIQGGFTMTGRTVPNAFNVLPIMVYRVFPDGREELVRGVDLIGTPLTAFGEIVAGDDEFGVFNGTCGAESGGVPVAAASPGILIDQIEVQKKDKSQERLPVLKAPLGPPPEVESGERVSGSQP